jgi:hypothetical protein
VPGGVTGGMSDRAGKGCRFPGSGELPRGEGAKLAPSCAGSNLLLGSFVHEVVVVTMRFEAGKASGGAASLVGWEMHDRHAQKGVGSSTAWAVQR